MHFGLFATKGLDVELRTKVTDLVIPTQTTLIFLVVSRELVQPSSSGRLKQCFMNVLLEILQREHFPSGTSLQVFDIA